jgi:hypothetical protein
MYHSNLYLCRNFNITCVFVSTIIAANNPCTGHYMSIGIQAVEASRHLDNRRMKVVRLTALGTGRLYSQEIFLVLISVKG